MHSGTAGDVASVLNQVSRLMLKTAALYSWGPGFKSRLGDGQSWLRIIVVLVTSPRQMPSEYLDHFVPHPSHFLLMQSYIILRYIIGAVDSLDK